MAAKKVEAKPKKERGPVMVHLFKDGNKYKDDVFVGVNEKKYQIQRGVDVEVPYEVAKILERSQRQDAKTAEKIAALEAKSR